MTQLTLTAMSSRTLAGTCLSGRVVPLERLDPFLIVRTFDRAIDIPPLRSV